MSGLLKILLATYRLLACSVVGLLAGWFLAALAAKLGGLL
jgi:hypothetical protein